jgi:hypothetical protein
MGSVLKRPAERNDEVFVSDAEIENAIRSVARLIHRYGDSYWPVFERLEAELKARNSRKERLSAYLPTTETDSGNQKRQTE